MVKIVKKKGMEDLMALQESPPKERGARPSLDIPDLPNLTSVPSKKLGRLFSKYTSLLGYVTQLTSDARIDKLTIKSRLKFRKAAVIFTSKGIKMQRIAAVWRDPDVISLQGDLIDVEARLLTYQGVIWTLRDNLRALDFEKERRMQERRLGEDYG